MIAAANEAMQRKNDAKYSRPGQVEIPPDLACHVCNKADDEASMLICDCGRGQHLRCLPRPLAAIPACEWRCAECASSNEPELFIITKTGTRTIPWPTTEGADPRQHRRLRRARTIESERVLHGQGSEKQQTHLVRANTAPASTKAADVETRAQRN